MTYAWWGAAAGNSSLVATVRSASAALITVANSSTHRRKCTLNLHSAAVINVVLHVRAQALACTKLIMLLVVSLSQGGELELSLLLGDPAAAVGTRYDLGSVVLPEAASDAPPKPKLLTATNQPRNNLKPNIAHTFVSGSCYCADQLH